MNVALHSPTRLAGVLVPKSLIKDPIRFGGVTVADCLYGDLILDQDTAVRLDPPSGSTTHIVMPRFTDPHVHLDKCHSFDRLSDVGGDLAAAIAEQARDRLTWTPEDIRLRASRGLAELEAAGCDTVRTHVDWGSSSDPKAVPIAWDVLGELAVDVAPVLHLERAALTNIGPLSEPEQADHIARHIAKSGGVLGSFIHGQPDYKMGLTQAFRAAEKFSLALDFHVDEGLSSGLDGVESIADCALATGFQGPVLLGHACALMNDEADDLARIIDKLARAQIAVTALPFTNLYLQGRTEGTPDRRGLTRIRELRAGGVNVVLGADNVRDAFCPMGNHTPLGTLSLAVLAAHLDPPFADHLPMITTQAEQALGRAPRTVDGAHSRDLIVFDAGSISELLCGTPKPRALSEKLEQKSS